MMMNDDDDLNNRVVGWLTWRRHLSLTSSYPVEVRQVKKDAILGNTRQEPRLLGLSVGIVVLGICMYAWLNCQ